MPQGSQPRYWARPGSLPGYVRLPATLPPQAAWPQQRFPRNREAGIATAYANPQVLYAPAAADTFEPPLDLTHGEPPLDGAYAAAPCTAPLVIHIGTPAATAGNGVRVVHAQQSPCAAPQVVTYQGPKIVQATPQAAAQAVAPRQGAAGRRTQTGFKVVRARF